VWLSAFLRSSSQLATCSVNPSVCSHHHAPPMPHDASKGLPLTCPASCRQVFYPHNGTILTDAKENMWLTTCGTSPHNEVDDVDYVAPKSARRLLTRSEKNW
jgi:hypothetical protein